MSWFIIQIQFLTRIPVPIKVDFTEKKLARSIVLAPIVGLIIGIILYGIYYLFSLTGHKAVALFLVVVSEIIITGGLHLDGLADTFDGIFSNRPKTKILEIMRDSRIGTNGTLSLIIVILLKVLLLFSIKENLIFYSIIIMPVLSRMNIIWSAGISNYARKGTGLAKSVVNHCGIKEIIISSVMGAVICSFFLEKISLIVFPAAILFVLMFVHFVKKKIGGITGDVIGAVIELSEAVVLLSVVVFSSILFFSGM